jgi:hypothetical protein
VPTRLAVTARAGRAVSEMTKTLRDVAPTRIRLTTEMNAIADPVLRALLVATLVPALATRER